MHELSLQVLYHGPPLYPLAPSLCRNKWMAICLVLSEVDLPLWTNALSLKLSWCDVWSAALLHHPMLSWCCVRGDHIDWRTSFPNNFSIFFRSNWLFNFILFFDFFHIQIYNKYFFPLFFWLAPPFFFQLPLSPLYFLLFQVFMKCGGSAEDGLLDLKTRWI